MVTDNQFVTTVEDADNINHLVIFLTGTQPFPDGFGGSGIFSKYNIIVTLQLCIIENNIVILHNDNYDCFICNDKSIMTIITIMIIIIGIYL